MRTLELEIHHEKTQIADAIGEIQNFLESNPAYEFAIGEEIYTAADLLKTGIWKDNFDQWEEIHAINHPCSDDRFFPIEELLLWRKQDFEDWLNEQKDFFYRG